MKKLIYVIAIVAAAVIMTACGGTDDAETTGNDVGTEAPEALEAAEIKTVEDFVQIEDVISVDKLTVESVADVDAFRLMFRSGDEAIAADIVLPSDYADEGVHHPVMLYFPEVGYDIESLAYNYALNGVGVVRMYARGFGDSEGVRDLGGDGDLSAAKTLLRICGSAQFMEGAKIFAVGSSEGSITALRLTASDTENMIAGCAVNDVISDLPAFIKARGEDIEALAVYLIGKTYEEAPEEYEKRSAVTFSDDLCSVPVLIVSYTQSQFVPLEQAEDLYESLKDKNKDCLYYEIDILMSDFSGEGLGRLLSWLNKYD